MPITQVFVRNTNVAAGGGNTAIVRASQANGGAPANQAAENASLCGTGEYVAFESAADNLVAGDVGGFVDVFVTRITGFSGVGPATTRVVSMSPGANGDSFDASMSADCRFVAFASRATNLVLAGTNGAAHVYVAEIAPSGGADLALVSLERVSVNPVTGAEGDGDSLQPALSADGRHVTFVSAATNLVAGDTNANGTQTNLDVFVYDRQTGTMERVNLTASGQQVASTSGDARHPTLSGNGRYVGFRSASPDLLVPNDADANADVFRVDRQTGAIEKLNVADSDGTPADTEVTVPLEDARHAPSLSTDGQEAAFSSFATNLVGGDTNTTFDVFVRGYDAATPSLNAADTDLGDAVFRSFAPATGVLAAGAQVAASRVVAAAGRALLAVPEAEEGGDLLNEPLDAKLTGAPAPNGDSDAVDEVAHLYDAVTDTMVNLGVALGSGLAALSDQVVCVGVSEAAHGGTVLNGDADTDDVVLAVGTVASLLTGGSLANTGIPVSAVGALGGLCVGISPNPGLRLYDVAAAAELPLDTPRSAADFQVTPGVDLVAFRVCEAVEGEDLNLDGDQLDCVMHVADTSMNPAKVINTERQADLCTLAACDAFELYRLRPDQTVSFIGREGVPNAVGQAPTGLPDPLPPGCLPDSPVDGCDLDGDGRSVSTVVHLVKIDQGAVAKSQTFPISEKAATEGTTSPFPDETAGETVLTVQLTECEAAQRCNSCPELQGLEIPPPGPPGCGTTSCLPYATGSCLASFDVDKQDLLQALDCDTLRTWIGPDSDGDGVADLACNRENDSCLELANPSQTDNDGDGLGDGTQTCDNDPNSLLPSQQSCDLNEDGSIDRLDVDIVFDAAGTTAANFPPAGWDVRDRDPDGTGPLEADGRIGVFDAALCAASCDLPDCAVPTAP